MSTRHKDGKGRSVMDCAKKAAGCGPFELQMRSKTCIVSEGPRTPRKPPPFTGSGSLQRARIVSRRLVRIRTATTSVRCVRVPETRGIRDAPFEERISRVSYRNGLSHVSGRVEIKRMSTQTTPATVPSVRRRCRHSIGGHEWLIRTRSLTPVSSSSTMRAVSRE
jgi:hypothetical protein